MAQRQHVPAFGNWESEENYTAYFDKARKGKSDKKLINPNDPQESLEANSEDRPSAYTTPVRSAPNTDPPVQASWGVARPKHEHHSSREDGEFKKSTDSPARPEVGVRRGFTDPPHSRGVNSSDSHRKGGRISGGSDRSIDQSPLHPPYQAKTPTRGGVSSPSWDKRGSQEGSHGLAPSTPGRSRLGPVETTEKSATVPKFGDWNENDPASADGFTHIFNQLREEKQTEAAKIPGVPTDSSYPQSRMHDNPDNAESTGFCSFCCFGSRK